MEVNNAGRSKISVDANGAKTTFDRFFKAEVDSYYSPYKFQNEISGDGGPLPQPFNTDFFLHEEPPLPYNSWAVQDDPYQLMNCAQGIPKKRNLADANDCGSETDLFGLVSDILEEVDPMDCYLSEEKSFGPKTVWSPKPMKEDSLQYLTSEVKMQPSPGMQSEYLCPEPMDRNSNQNTDIYQHFNSFDVADPSWLFSACNGESEAYFTRPPPCLSIPPAVNAYIPKGRAGKSEYGVPVPGKDSSFCSTRDALYENMNALNDSCCSSNEMNDSYFSPYKDVSGMSRHKSHRMPVAMQDADRMASNIQALLVGEQKVSYKRDSAPNNFMSVQDDKTFDLKRLVAQMPSLKRDVIECLGEQRGSDIGRSQPFQSDYTTKEFSGFGQQSDYFEPPKSFSSLFNPPTPHQSTDTRLRETRPAPSSLHQHHHSQPSQYQSQTKLPAKASINSHHQGISELMSHSVAEYVHPVLSSQQRPTGRDFTDFGQGVGMSLQERMNQTGLGLGLESLRNMAGSEDGGNFRVQPGSNSRLQASPATGFTSDGHKSQPFGMKSKPLANFPREAVKKQGLLQNPHQILGAIYAGQARHNGPGPSQAKSVPPQMFPYTFKMGDPRQNPCHLFISHPLLPFGSSVPLMEMKDFLPEIPILNPFLQELIGPNTAGADFPGFLSTMRPTKFSKEPKSQGTILSQLHQYLEECYEQWKMLEKERKKAESVLVKSYPGKRVFVVNNNPLPKMPSNPSRVDRLIVDQLREQGKVVSLLGRMECLRSFPLHANICSALDRHLEAIHITQARRKDEFLNSSSRQRQGSAYLREDRETILLASALKDLSSSTRKSRSALWCALQMTLPKNGASPLDGGAGDTCSSLGQNSPERAVHTL
ncbi:meiosis-specific coiled-coil domain-containing protein MEIOC isoform X1 [Astyanax mexicanus]|uniref:meiosis-specific coiled-coil domain-containing protein MEIOC isoform X1 n=1 Tax=Astyanax mexicanus TaxID=7994 RepID=UPI0020CAEAA0|nr:meiosis-specific coiled-coil domain-containing protein MEIOC isoform X1 [Astyanax mexicanus]